MKLNKNDILHRLNALSARERFLSAITLIIVFVYGLYTFVYAPISAEKNQLEDKIEAQSEVYQYLKNIQSEVSALRKLKRADVNAKSTDSLMTLVEATSVQQQIKPLINTITSEGDNKVNIRIDAIDFDMLIAWLVELETTQGISVLQINCALLAQEKPSVSVQMMLAR